MKSEMIIVRVKPNLKRRLLLIAEGQEMTPAEVYRDAFEEYCAARIGGVLRPGALPEKRAEFEPGLARHGGFGE